MSTKSKKIKNNLTPEQSNYYYQLANTGIEAQSKNILIDNRSDYEIAMDNGKDFMKKADNTITESEADALSLYFTANSIIIRSRTRSPFSAQKEKSAA